MITRDMIRAGFESGRLALFDSPDGGTALMAGANWCYFDPIASDMTMAEYLAECTLDDVIDRVFESFEVERIEYGDNDPEWLSWFYYLDMPEIPAVA